MMRIAQCYRETGSLRGHQIDSWWRRPIKIKITYRISNFGIAFELRLKRPGQLLELMTDVYVQIKLSTPALRWVYTDLGVR